MVERDRRLHAETARAFRSREPRTCVATVPYLASIESAGAARRPIAHHRPRSPGAKAFAALWDEVRSLSLLDASHDPDEAVPR
jgi:cellulose biosynthesis protein BcsQ